MFGGIAKALNPKMSHQVTPLTTGRTDFGSGRLQPERDPGRDPAAALPGTPRNLPPLDSPGREEIRKETRVLSEEEEVNSKRVGIGRGTLLESMKMVGRQASFHETQPNTSSMQTEFQFTPKGLFLPKHFLMLNPENKIYNNWWQLTVLLTYWNLFQVPFTVAFQVRDGWVDYLVWLVDMLFFVDIFITLSTPIYIHGQQYTDRKTIAKNYLKLHFWIDLLASVPFDRIGTAILPDNDFIRLLAFTRTLRVRRLVLLLSKTEKNIHINYESVVLVKLLTMVSVLAHLEACLFWYVGYVSNNASWREDFIVDGEESIDNWSMYLISLYWAVTTYTTVGYGDLHPINNAERTYAIFVMIINMALTAYVLGNITMLTTKVDQSVLEYRANVSQVRAYLARKKVSPELVDMAIQQLQTSQELSEETDRALDLCAPYIRNRILSSLYNDRLSQCNLFYGCSNQFVNSIVHNASMEFFQPDTLIIRCKERANGLYYVLSGSISVLSEENKHLRSIRAGGTFGAESVMCELPQHYGVKSRSLVKALAIDANSIRSICNQYKLDHRVACNNLVSQLETLKPADDREAEDIKTATLQIRSHISSLKTDMVTKLCYCASTGDLLGLKALLASDKEHNINDGDYDGRRPLHVAAAGGHLQMIDYLVLSEGADVNALDSFGGAPLLDAVKSQNQQAAALLRQYGAELMLSDTGTTMCSLVMTGRIEQVKLYLDNGADPNVGDYDRRTPLHIACAEGNVPLVKLLIAYGGDIHFTDRFGTTPLDEAENFKGEVTVKNFIKSVCNPDPVKKWVIARDKLEVLKRQMDEEEQKLKEEEAEELRLASNRLGSAKYAAAAEQLQ